MKYNTHKPQVEKDWAGEVRTIVYLGKCAVCGRTVYGYSDQPAPDPRGLISPDHTNHPLNPTDYDMTGDPLLMCFTCNNAGDTYHKGLKIAMGLWKPR